MCEESIKAFNLFIKLHTSDCKINTFFETCTVELFFPLKCNISRESEQNFSLKY